MTKQQIELIVGALLHDIGKVVYRSGDGRNHSQSGYDFLKNDVKLENTSVLNCVRYHHGSHIRNAKLDVLDLSYLVYYADNVAAAVDRREAEAGESGFDKNVPLQSVFNILNGNNEKKHYEKCLLNLKNGIIMPTERPLLMDEEFYQQVISDLKKNLQGIVFSKDYINSLLSVLEANLTYIPSSTSKKELADISLFDHVKMTAAIASCIKQFLDAKGCNDYREVLLEKSIGSYEEKMFLLYSLDISGIQDFIYTISSEGALKGLRARSFYLEILMEHIVDELLETTELSRANLIYVGGGHSYILLPNTSEIREKVKKFENGVNQWFLKTYGTSLYIAGGYAEASANDLKNEPNGSYSQLYLTISKKISEKKTHRYQEQDILFLNSLSQEDGERECRICRRVGNVDEKQRCAICAAMEKMAGNILHQEFFTVIRTNEKGCLPLPGNCYLVADTETTLRARMGTEDYVRCYTKNGFYTGLQVTTRLWVGDYSTGETFEALAEKSKGIARLGVLRADVDNLGKTFVSGFERADGDNRYATLLRTATLSRMLSLFFKGYINSIFAEKQRNLVIVYSGGDDVFLVGAWNEVISGFVDLREAFVKFTQETLSISGGIGMYPSGYPINIMAKEVAELEDAAKALPGKNAISLFTKKHTYRWEDFLKHVIDEKYKTVQSFFDFSDSKGKAFLYRLLELLENAGETINRARFVYLLSRFEPDNDAGKGQLEAYRSFSKKMLSWYDSAQDRKETLMAMYLYVYETREREVE